MIKKVDTVSNWLSMKVISFIILIILNVFLISLFIVTPPEPSNLEVKTYHLSTDIEDTENSNIPDMIEPTWWKTFGGSYYDGEGAIKQTRDDGFIITGWTQPNGLVYSKIWLIKTSSDGSEQWNRTYGGPKGDFGVDILENDDGGYIILGSTYSFGVGKLDIIVIKTNSAGQEQWNKTYGGSEDDFASAIRKTLDGGYIIGASSQSFGDGDSDVWLIKIDLNGNEQWNMTMGNEFDQTLNSLEQTSDGGVIFTGATYEGINKSKNLWLVKTNESGFIQWNQTFGGNMSDTGFDLIQTQDGGFIVSGEKYAYGEYNRDAWVIKTNATGAMLWNRTYGGKNLASAKSIQMNSEGGYFLLGTIILEENNNVDLWLAKISSTGDEIWNRTFGGPRDESGYEIEPTDDDGFIIIGKSVSFGSGFPDILILKIDSEGGGIITNKPPTCTILEPLSNTTVSGTFEINGIAHDIDGDWDLDDDVEFVELRLDDESWEEAFYSWRTNKWDIRFDTIHYENGEHTIFARSYDGELYSVFENSTITIFINNQDTVGEDSDNFEEVDPSFFNKFMWVCIIVIIIGAVVGVVILYFVYKAIHDNM